jgi:DNA-directed RNA polymerase specialized sigma24 family protein
MGFPSRHPRLLSVAHAPDPGVNQFGDSRRAPARGGLMQIPGSSRSSEITRRADVPSMPPTWLPAFRSAWRALAGGPAQTPVGHGPTESSDRQPEPETAVRDMSAAAGLGSGAALDGEASAAPPSAFPPPAPRDSREHSERPADPGQCARLRALSATLPTPDREIILLWAVVGVSIPNIAATLGITSAAVRRAQTRALSALPPAATANGPPPATRQRVVLLPHVRNRPTTAAQEAAR